MAGSDSSVRGGRYEDEEPPVALAELHQLQNSLLQAMERMFNERLPAAGGRIPRNQYEESGVKILVMVMTISEMVVIVVEEVDMVVVMTGVQEVIMNKVVVCTLMMKMNFRRTLMRGLILILLQTEGSLDMIMIAVVMVVMMGNIAMVATRMIQIILLV
jgi:hypothetical protein